MSYSFQAPDPTSGISRGPCLSPFFFFFLVFHRLITVRYLCNFIDKLWTYETILKKNSNRGRRRLIRFCSRHPNYNRFSISFNCRMRRQNGVVHWKTLGKLPISHVTASLTRYPLPLLKSFTHDHKPEFFSPISGGSKNLERGEGGAPERGGGHPLNGEKINIFWVSYLEFINVTW
jgi:hypothetical protein